MRNFWSLTMLKYIASKCQELTPDVFALSERQQSLESCCAAHTDSSIVRYTRLFHCQIEQQLAQVQHFTYK